MLITALLLNPGFSSKADTSVQHATLDRPFDL